MLTGKLAKKKVFLINNFDAVRFDNRSYCKIYKHCGYTNLCINYYYYF